MAGSADGLHVFLTGGERFRDRTIVAFRLGAPRARVLRVPVGDFYDMAALLSRTTKPRGSLSPSETIGYASLGAGEGRLWLR